MSEVTKACSLTKDEITMLVMSVGREMDETNIDATLDRLNYLNRRLKAFDEVEIVKETPQPEEEKKDGW